MRLCGVSLSYLDPAGPRGPEGVMTNFSLFGILRLTGTRICFQSIRTV